LSQDHPASRIGPDLAATLPEFGIPGKPKPAAHGVGHDATGFTAVVAVAAPTTPANPDRLTDLYRGK
jgi:hypothetical protein